MNHEPKKDIQFVFFGTPEPAAEILDILKTAGYAPPLIVTNPDKPQGRTLKTTPSPVKEWAVKNNIPCLQPEKLDSSFNLQLKTYNLELFIVVAYGALMPKETLAMPAHGALNIHYSLLPKYKGASPIESQILADDRDVGVTIMQMDEKMDHGPIVAQRNLQLTTYNLQLQWPPKASELRRAMNKIAGELLVEIIPKWIAGEIKPTPQDHTKATYTRKFTKEDGAIDLSGDPYKNFLKIRAFEESIGTYFLFSHSPLSKGRQRGVAPKKIRVIIKDAKYESGKLIFTRVVPEGKKEMPYEEFLRGIR